MKVLIVVLFAAAAFAQTTSRSGTLGGVIGPVPSAQVVAPGWTFTTAASGTIAGGVVTGAPYSAEEVTEHIQTLADGTHINQPAPKVKYYRDSQGRTRTERTFPGPAGALGAADDGPTLIEIFDPVTGARYTLEPRNHTARKISFPPAPPPPPPPPNSASVPANRAIRILSAAGPVPSPSSPYGQAQGPQFSRESLGMQTFEGVLAEGSRSTVIYPIGAVGNDRPITTISEFWVSPELHTVVLSKSSDPRNGDSTTRLTNISRSDPDPSLFQIPADYEVVDPQAAVQKP